MNVTIDDLVHQYQVLLLDAYGVLVDGTGALPGAATILASIERADRSFLVVTNDASCQPETISARFQHLNLRVPTERIITSGSLIPPYFEHHGLQGARTMVLGTEDCFAYVDQAGGVRVPIAPDSDIDALVICTGEGFPFLQGIENALSAVVRQLRRERPVALIVANPDLIYPRDDRRYGFTAGAAAMLVEAGLARVFPERALSFAALGKPSRFMFDRARELAGTDNLVMIGDQLQTDIVGANEADIASALIDTGLSEWRAQTDLLRPDYLLRAPSPLQS